MHLCEEPTECYCHDGHSEHTGHISDSSRETCVVSESVWPNQTHALCPSLLQTVLVLKALAWCSKTASVIALWILCTFAKHSGLDLAMCGSLSAISFLWVEIALKALRKGKKKGKSLYLIQTIYHLSKLLQLVNFLNTVLTGPRPLACWGCYYSSHNKRGQR